MHKSDHVKQRNLIMLSTERITQAHLTKCFAAIFQVVTDLAFQEITWGRHFERLKVLQFWTHTENSLQQKGDFIHKIFFRLLHMNTVQWSWSLSLSFSSPLPSSSPSPSKRFPIPSLPTFSCLSQYIQKHLSQYVAVCESALLHASLMPL